MAIIEPELLTADIIEVYQSNITAIKHQLGRPVDIVWNETQSGCPNCFYDKALKTSKGIYRPGGPIYFDKITCPYCAGKGAITVTGKMTLSGNIYYTSIKQTEVDKGSTFDSQINSASFLISECYVNSGVYNGKLVFDVCDHLVIDGDKWIIDGKPMGGGLGNERFVIEVRVKHSNK